MLQRLFQNSILTRVSGTQFWKAFNLQVNQDLHCIMRFFVFLPISWVYLPIKKPTATSPKNISLPRCQTKLCQNAIIKIAFAFDEQIYTISC